MRAAVAVVVALGVAAPAIAPAAPVGAPRELRVARIADARPHAGARTEFWELLAIDPRSRRTVTMRLRRAPGLESVDVFVAGGSQPSRQLGVAQSFQRASGPLVHFSGSGGTTTIERARGGVDVTLEGPELAGRLTLRRVRPGPLARRWSLGTAVRFPAGRFEPTGMSWDVPVATSVAAGELRVGEERLRLAGWRASLEHVWGSFDLHDDAWEHWDAYTVHGRRGDAWLAFGLNRRETTLGPGARDGQYLGVLARVTRRGTRICRPRVHRRRWTYALGEWPSARLLRARCRGLRVTLREVRDDASLWAERYVGLYEYADQATAGGRWIGFGRHRGHTWSN